jgi:ParB family chromosome partitioning protein
MAAASYVKSIPLADIACEPQVRERFDEDGIAGLAKSMAEVGLLQPIRVRRSGDGWVVLDGERRLRAAALAGWTEIPAVVEESELSEADILQRQLIANCQRENLSPIERAAAIRRLMQAEGWTAAHTAARLGLSPASVSKLLTLLALPKDVQELVRGGDLAASTAYEVAKVVEPEERAALAEQARQGRLTRDQASARSRGRRGRPGRRAARAAPARLPRVVLPLDGRVSVTVSGLDLSVGAVVSWLEQLLERLQPLAESGLEIEEARRHLAAACRPRSAPDQKGKEEGDA